MNSHGHGHSLPWPYAPMIWFLCSPHRTRPFRKASKTGALRKHFSSFPWLAQFVQLSVLNFRTLAPPIVSACFPVLCLPE